MESNVRGKVWKDIYNIGIDPKDKLKDYKKKIAKMEEKDRERKIGWN